MDYPLIKCPRCNARPGDPCRTDERFVRVGLKSKEVPPHKLRDGLAPGELVLISVPDSMPRVGLLSGVSAQLCEVRPWSLIKRRFGLPITFRRDRVRRVLDSDESLQLSDARALVARFEPSVGARFNMPSPGPGDVVVNTVNEEWVFVTPDKFHLGKQSFSRLEWRWKTILGQIEPV